jgi:hypothetical protein
VREGERALLAQHPSLDSLRRGGGSMPSSSASARR